MPCCEVGLNVIIEFVATKKDEYHFDGKQHTAKIKAVSVGKL